MRERRTIAGSEKSCRQLVIANVHGRFTDRGGGRCRQPNERQGWLFMNYCNHFWTTRLAMAALLAVSTTNDARANDASPPPGCTGPASATWVNVVVEGLRNGSGLLAITLYADDSSKFLVRHGSLYVGRTQAVAGTQHACIFLPHPGVYALALYHDENANEKFDRNAIGLPQEGYGFSNNPSTLFGLPSFQSVRLNVSQTGLSTHIKIKYP